MVSWRATLACSILLALAVPASAAPAEFSLDAAFPAVAEGRVEVEAQEARLLLQDATGHASMQLEGTFELTRLVYRSFGYVHPGDPEMKVLWGQDLERHQLRPGHVALEERRSGFQLLAWDATARMSTASAAVGSTTEPTLVEATDARSGIMLATGGAATPSFEHTIDEGMLATHAAAGTVRLTGSFQAFLQGAVLDADGTTIQAHFRQEQRPGTIYDPVAGEWIGGGSHTEYIQEYVLIEAEDALLRIDHTGLPVRNYAPAARLSVDGEATLADAEGTILVTQDDDLVRHDVTGEEVSLAGSFVMDLEGRDGRLQATGEGDVTHVAYGTFGATYEWGTVATLTFGAAIVAALAWAVKLFGVAGYARVQGPKVLDHPGRQEVYDRVKAHPGIGFAQLVQQVPFGESTLQYHLRVLEKNGFVTRLKDGRYQRFFDRQCGLYSADRKVAVSALRNDTTARIARTILEEPGIAQQDLAHRFGIAASTVNWHIQRLQRVGLVDRRRDHPHTRYYAGTAWASIPGDEHTRLVTA